MTLVPVATPLTVSTQASATTLTFAAFTPTVGELLVIKVMGEQGGGTPIPAVPSGGPTWTLLAGTQETVTTECFVSIYTATVASAVSTTVTVNAPRGNASAINPHWSAVLERWPVGSTLGATKSFVNGTGAPSTTLTTTGTGSAVTWGNTDYNAASPAGHTYNSTSATPTEDWLDDQSVSTAYVAYSAYQQAASPGSQTLGLTAPTTQTWTLFGVEIVPAAVGGGTATPGPRNFTMAAVQRASSW